MQRDIIIALGAFRAIRTEVVAVRVVIEELDPVCFFLPTLVPAPDFRDCVCCVVMGSLTSTSYERGGRGRGGGRTSQLSTNTAAFNIDNTYGEGDFTLAPSPNFSLCADGVAGVEVTDLVVEEGGGLVAGVFIVTAAEQAEAL